MGFVTLTWPFTRLVRLGWATAGTPNPDPLNAVGRVFVLRGQGMVFSRGLGSICAQLRRAGWWAEDLRCVGDLWLQSHLKTEHQAGRLGGPLVFVGHSCGGRSALSVARHLEPLGIGVRLIICLDVAFPSPVTANVEEAVHLYRSRRRLYPAGPLRPAAASPSLIENIDLDSADSPLLDRGLNHLNMAQHPAVQQLILRRIFGIV